MIRQVRLREKYMSSNGQLVDRNEPVFAFGTHPDVTSDDEAHPVTSASALGNKLRIIVDELLVGNNIEEIACRGQVDSDAYSTVPVGATPDDIARCSVAKDVLPQSCSGSNPKSVCICQLDGGCGEAAKGMPVGVLDVNADGAADDTRMIQGAVGLKCGNVDVQLDLNNSYWNPSGDQNPPAMGGFDALGPAIVLVAAPVDPMIDQFLPTNTTCGLSFAPTIVDKQMNQICTPDNGDITKGCTPGDVSKFSFHVEPLRVTQTTVMNNATGVNRTDPFIISLSAPITMASLAAITVTQGTTAYTNFTATLQGPVQIRLTWTGGLAPTTQYTVNVGTGVADLYNQPLPTPTAVTFTTGS